MKKKFKSVALLALLAILCLVLFASCRAGEKVDFFEYGEKDLGVIGRLVKWMHGWIGNYGWTVVVFTVFLKVIMSPLDFWQRYSSRKSAVKMQKLQPLLEGIDKRYGANTQRANEEKQKLYSKQGYSMASMCLPMIVTWVVFFIMFSGLRSYATYNSITNFKNLSEVYYEQCYERIVALDGGESEAAKACKAKYDEATADMASKSETEQLIAKFKGWNDGIDAAKAKLDAEAFKTIQQEAIAEVQKAYMANHESWLWIQNVWQPDTWEAIMPHFDSGANSFASQLKMDQFPDDTDGKSLYENIIRPAILETGIRGDNGAWNGLMILPIMSVGLSFLSIFISQLVERKNRKGEVVAQNQQQATTNKTMMIIMPLMMAFFGFMYTGAFAIYMVCNYTISTLSTVLLRVPVEKAVEKRLAKEDEKNNTSKAKYMR